MASIKITGLTKEQANAIAMGFESEKFIDEINEELNRLDCPMIEIENVQFDSSFDPDNEIIVMAYDAEE